MNKEKEEKRVGEREANEEERALIGAAAAAADTHSSDVEPLVERDGRLERW